MKITKDIQLNLLKLFNVMAVPQTSSITKTTLLSDYGVLTNFQISNIQKDAIMEYCKPLDVKVLFGKTERDEKSTLELINKQLLHYLEVYGLNSPGLFDLEVDEGEVIKLTFIKGLTIPEINDMILDLLYSNAPVKDTTMIQNLITSLQVSFDFDKIQNNELRIVLFDITKHVFNNGDDAVRYMCFKATDNSLLIKSKEVIDAVKLHKFPSAFFEKHDIQLAQVFNRHKKIIMSAKNPNTKTAINRISRLSKQKHVPIKESVNKKFISLALEQKVSIGTLFNILDSVSIRDKFKFLNLLEYKKMRSTMDAFIIRNGKIHLEEGRKVHDLSMIEKVKNMVLKSLEEDFLNLKDKTILLDNNVDYGLPVSRKQTIGNLPFGTEVHVKNAKISSGVYWRNDWGATDLDLSTIDYTGKRTGWGSYSGYDKTNPVTFSGDMTSAYDGAMEFMTSNNVDYGLFVNIYSGSTGAGFELVVGENGKDRWIQNTIIREKDNLKSRGNVIGFVKNDKFIVYQGRLSSNYISGDKKSEVIVKRGASEWWTVKRLFDSIGIKYSLDKEENVSYDYDLSYESFSYDKLENILLK
jgi:hypothetical protein